MTCIVGLVHNNITYMGCDSLASNGHLKQIRKDKKMFKVNDRSIIGFTTSYRMGQLLMYERDLIDYENHGIDHRYMVTEFIPKVISKFQDGNFDESGNKGGVFLVTYKNRLFRIESDYQVAENINKYDSCGCGEEFALGSLHSTEGLDLSPEERIFKALESAEKFSVGVQRPFYIMNTENNEIKVME